MRAREAVVVWVTDGVVTGDRWKHERSKMTRGRSWAMSIQKGAWTAKEQEPLVVDPNFARW
ncbi:hypothetical protein AALP_AA2G043300 [Arabis alpina]|uniref:Uncharacterized protein n=1 Tax=Arabis alpina TaxID=50452 RepID=A0A087HFA3_ARAAL|nr:hypothetical protein AALP_AA2G043300 [Arabis alpina]